MDEPAPAKQRARISHRFKLQAALRPKNRRSTHILSTTTVSCQRPVWLGALTNEAIHLKTSRGMGASSAWCSRFATDLAFAHRTRRALLTSCGLLHRCARPVRPPEVWLGGADDPDREQVPQALQVSATAALPMVRRSRTARYSALLRASELRANRRGGPVGQVEERGAAWGRLPATYSRLPEHFPVGLPPNRTETFTEATPLVSLQGGSVQAVLAFQPAHPVGNTIPS